ncbi:MAG: hypothetical protein R3F42_15830 [Pseudomonadota bacterium]
MAACLAYPIIGPMLYI